MKILLLYSESVYSLCIIKNQLAIYELLTTDVKKYHTKQNKS